MNYAFILAGGKGERLWPFSREKKPKQLLKLFSDKTMIEETIGRLEGFISLDKTFIVCNRSLRDIILDYIPFLTKKNFIVEPMARNSAPAIYLASHYLERIDPQGIMYILPADHYISPQDELINTLKKAGKIADETYGLVTLGILPTYPEIGYGYIINRPDSYKVDEFTEKPELETAEKYFHSKKAYWNSGMFIWKNHTFLKELKQHQKNDYLLLDQMKKYTLEEIQNGETEEIFKKITANSIDYSIMEKSKNVYCIPATFHWNDVGSWNSFEKIIKPDKMNNTCKGKVYSLKSNRNIVFSDQQLIALFGVDDLTVVSTEDVVFICPKKKNSMIKEFILSMRNEDDMKNYL